MLKTKKRDWPVELVRIIGCLIVLGCHTVPGPNNVDGDYSKSRVLLQCLFGDGVAVFWVITGFFIFANFDYKKRLKKTASRILLPYALFTVFIFYFYQFIVNRVPLADSLSHNANDYVFLLHNAITLNVIPPNSLHLWYVVAYLFLIVVSPLFYGFAQQTVTNKSVAKWYLILLFIFLLINDVTSNQTFGFSHHGLGALGGSIVLVLYGNILYTNRQKFIWKGWLVLAPLMFIALGLVRMGIQLSTFSKDPGNIHILFWYTTFGVINTTLIAAFCFSLSTIENKFSKITNLLVTIGSYTFSIYVIHPLILHILWNRGILPKLMNDIIGFGTPGNLFTNSAYHLSVILIVFFISLMSCVILRIFKNVFLVIAYKFLKRH